MLGTESRELCSGQEVPEQRLESHLKILVGFCILPPNLCIILMALMESLVDNV